MDARTRPGVSILVLRSPTAPSASHLANVVQSVSTDAPEIHSTATLPFDAYGGLLTFLRREQSWSDFVGTLPSDLRELPRSAMPRQVARHLPSLATSPIWIVSPADALTASAIRFLEELCDQTELARAGKSLTILLACSADQDLPQTLTRRLRSLAIQDLPWAPTPPADLPALPLSALDLIAIISLSERAIPLPLAATVAGIGEEEARAVLRQLEGGSRGGSDLPEPVRAAALARLDDKQRTEIHERLGRAWQQVDEPALAAAHLLQSTEPRQAVGPLIDAAARARAFGDLEAAVAALRQAYLSLDPDQWYRRIEILEQSAEVLTESGDFHDAVAALEEIAELAQLYGGQDSPDRLALVARSYREIGKFDEAARALERARGLPDVSAEAALGLEVEEIELSLARGNHDATDRRIRDGLAQRPEQPELLELGCRLAVHRTRPDDIVQYGRQLLDAATRVGDKLYIARAHTHLGYAYFARSQLGDSRRHYSISLHLAEEQGDRILTTRMLLNLATLSFEGGELAEALDALERALELNRREGDLRGVAMAWNNMAAIHFDRGELQRAAELIEGSLSIMEELHDEVWQAALHANLAAVLSGLGRRRELQPHLDAARRLARTASSPMVLGAIAYAAGEAAFLGRDLERARQELLQSRSHFSDLGSRTLECRILRKLAEVEELAGSQPESLKWAEEALEIAEAIPHPGHASLARLAIARATVSRDPVRAEALARQTYDTGQAQLGASFRAGCLALLAQAALLMGRNDESQELHGQARDELGKHAAQVRDPTRRRALLAHPWWLHVLKRTDR